MARLHAFPDEQAPALRLASALGLELSPIETHVFPDGELLPRVRVQDMAGAALVYRSLNRPNDKLVELALAADALRRGGARRLVLVAPYLPYMRQDKAFVSGEPVSQRVIATLLDGLFDRIVTVDPHLHRTRALADIFQRADATHVRSAEALAPFLRQQGLDQDLVIVGPDAESAPWVAGIASPLGLTGLVLAKQRRGDRSVEIALPADCPVAGRPVLIVDDICSSGTTLAQAALALHAAGARSVSVYVTHILLSEASLESLREAGVGQVMSSDSCVHPTNRVHLAPVLAAALADEAPAEGR